ncbi:hypothetical protein [Citrobacter sp. Res13-Sevr-PEB04-36]|uniref:hypothetical protein n=1 Tax=Citrobacter sp. Res13-Sevr-PEB04-36 TaxID=2777960 RepID=UPI0018ACE5D5|nr:hypothetical protein [Citrobacter sp. Res13-Sevr-PEB04-36]
MFYGSVGVLGAGCWVLGAVAMAWLPLLKTLSAAHTRQSLMRFAAMLVVAIVVVRLLAQPAYMSYLANVSLSGIVTLPHQPLDAFNQLNSLRLFTWTVSVIGSLLFAVSAWRNRSAGLLVGGLLLLVSEVLFRFIFFCIS